MNALDQSLHAIENETINYTEPHQFLMAAKARALMRGYDARWHRAGYVTISVEDMLMGPIQNPDTNRPAKVFRMAGKLDVLATLQGRLTLIDHKTTSQDITDPNSPYWRQLAVDSQVSHYMLLSWLNGQKIDDAVWDVIRKPSISPKKLTKADHKKTMESKLYFGETVSDDDIAELNTTGRETHNMYGSRLAHDCMNERPDWYFQRRSVPRFDGEILDYANELWQHSKDVLHERKKELPVRNSGACMLYGSPCQFLGICSGHDTVESDRWKKKECVHAELPEIEGDGKNILTNSRIRCFQTCRRKHHYQYELGIERNDSEDREALVFGSLMHVALETWFNCFLTPKESENDNCNSTPANDVGKPAADLIPF